MLQRQDAFVFLRSMDADSQMRTKHVEEPQEMATEKYQRWRLSVILN